MHLFTLRGQPQKVGGQSDRDRRADRRADRESGRERVEREREERERARESERGTTAPHGRGTHLAHAAVAEEGRVRPLFLRLSVPRRRARHDRPHRLRIDGNVRPAFDTEGHPERLPQLHLRGQGGPLVRLLVPCHQNIVQNLTRRFGGDLDHHTGKAHQVMSAGAANRARARTHARARGVSGDQVIGPGRCCGCLCLALMPVSQQTAPARARPLPPGWNFSQGARGLSPRHPTRHTPPTNNTHAELPLRRARAGGRRQRARAGEASGHAPWCARATICRIENAGAGCGGTYQRPRPEVRAAAGPRGGRVARLVPRRVEPRVRPALRCRGPRQLHLPLALPS